MATFTGFPAETLTFLRELEKNNNRDWFQENKQRYEEAVRGPALDFIGAIAEPLSAISDHFTAIPKKSGGSLMRVYRDVRFSKDKSPYKTNIGIQFRHELGKDVHAPGYYLHIANDECFLGAGIWHPESSALTKIRERIDQHQGDWNKVIRQRSFSSTFDLGGDSLKRPPRGYTADHPRIEDLKRKDFIAVANVNAVDIQKASFVADVAGTFRRADGLMAFLCAALEVNF